MNVTDHIDCLYLLFTFQFEIVETNILIFMQMIQTLSLLILYSRMQKKMFIIYFFESLKACQTN